MNPSLVILGLFVASSSIGISKSIFRSYISPVSLYFTVWGMVFGAFHLGVVRYLPLSTEALLIVILSWVAFAIGCLVALSGNRQSFLTVYRWSHLGAERWLKLGILIFSMIAFMAAVIDWQTAEQSFGDLGIVWSEPYVVRQALLRGDVPRLRVVLYLSTLGLAASALAGIYAASYSARSPVVYLPFLPLLVQGLLTSGRVNVFWGMLLWSNALILVQISTARLQITKRQIVAIILVLVITVAGVSAIRVRRAGDIELGRYLTYLNYVNLDLGAFSRSTPFYLLIDAYVYFTGPLGVFSASLNFAPASYLWGEATFNPFFIGSSFRYIRDPLPIPFYMNSSTYLRSLFEDWGVAGTVLFPFILGFILVYLYKRYRARPTYFLVGLLSFGFLFVEMSVYNTLTTFGQFWIALAATGFVSHICDYLAACVVESRASALAGNTGGGGFCDTSLPK